MNDDFTTKWEEIAERGYHAGRFRVRPEHVLDMFLGYTESGEREFVLETMSSELDTAEFAELENIAITRARSAKHLGVRITLKDAGLKDIFSVMCLDLADASSTAATADGAVSIFVSRMNRWIRLFKQRWTHEMSFEERLGLLGELETLLWLLHEGAQDPATCVSGWRGPHGDSTDIGVNGLHLEVKAQMSSRPPRLHISSLDQLDTSGRTLCVIHYRYSSSDHGLSLGTAVGEIEAALAGNETVLRDFRGKLFVTGFDPDAAYLETIFRRDERVIYEVSGKFPRLVSTNVPAGIESARYLITCTALSSFVIHTSRLWELLNA